MQLEICLYLSYGDKSAIFSSSPTLSNGMVERNYQVLRDALRSLLINRPKED